MDICGTDIQVRGPLVQLTHNGPVRFAEKTSRNTVPVDLLREKTLFRSKKQAEKDGL